jgi:hypothetical protein
LPFELLVDDPEPANDNDDVIFKQVIQEALIEP